MVVANANASYHSPIPARPVQACAWLRAAADSEGAMIDILVFRQLSIARRIRMAARRGNSGKALELYREWKWIDKEIKELC